MTDANKIAQLFRDWNDIVEFPAGAEIVSGNDPVTSVFVVLSGEVELGFRGKRLGREVPGGIFGETAMLPDAIDSPTVTAISDVKLARLDGEQFNRLVATNPAFSKHALLCMANRLRAANAFISTHLEGSD
jgi:CRP-like cAMP-binding protein